MLTGVILGGIFLLLGALLFLIAAVFLGWAGGVVTIAQASKSWPSARATIKQSEIRSNRRANGLPGHRYRVIYEFEVARKSFESNLVGAGEFPYLTKSLASGRIANYPVGKQVTARYNPAEPDIAVLEPGWRWECAYAVLIELLMVATSLTLLFVGARQLFLLFTS